MSTTNPRRANIIGAFAAVYIIWGSTYLAIRYAVETIPPYVMGGVRFLIAGTILYVVSRAKGIGPPTRSNWLGATIIGGLLFVGGNGLLCWAEQSVPSGVCSLLIATGSLWIVILGWFEHRREKFDPRVVAGLVLGFAGLFLLLGPGHRSGSQPVRPLAAAALLAGSLSWGAGSVYGRRFKIPASPFLAAAMEMISGGIMMIVVALIAGEGRSFHPSSVSTRSLLALAYLVTLGSLAGFTSYAYLIAHSTPSAISTYAYVNPVVAVILGWAVAGEMITGRILLAAAITLGGVAIIVAARSRSPHPEEAVLEPAE